MQLIILTVVCAKCKQTNQLRISDQSTELLKCKHCQTFLFDYLVINGFLYVLANSAMPGLLKIGFTSRSVAQRVQELNSATGVPTNFEVVAYFGCTDPITDEKIVHRALGGSRPGEKEFFDISITEAVNKIEAILQRKPLFISGHYEIPKVEDVQSQPHKWWAEIKERETRKTDSGAEWEARRANWRAEKGIPQEQPFERTTKETEQEVVRQLERTTKEAEQEAVRQRNAAFHRSTELSRKISRSK